MGSNALDDRRAGTDIVLTNLSIGIPLDQGYIGDSLAPSLKVPVSTVKLPVWGTEAFRIREDRIADFSEPDKLDISLGTTSVEVDGHALMGVVSYRHQIESQRGPLKVDLDFEVLQTVVASMRLAREKQQADLFTATATYGATHKQDQNGLARLWSDPAIDPIEDLIPMIETTIPDDANTRPNTLWMGQPVWAALMLNPLVRNRIFGQVGPQPIPTTAQFANLVGIDNVLVGRAAGRDAAGTVTQLWGKNAGLAYVAPAAGKRMPSFAYTVEETVFGSASEKVVRIDDRKMGASGGEWIKRSAFYTVAVLFNSSGSLFYNAVA